MNQLIEIEKKLAAASILQLDQEKILGLLKIADEQDLALINEIMADPAMTRLLVQNLKQKVAALQSGDPIIAAEIIAAEIEYLEDAQEQEVRQSITNLW